MITWMNRTQFLREEAWKGAVAISIIDPYKGELPDLFGWFDWIQFAFGDSEEWESDAMTEGNALSLWKFINRNADKERDWVIHCEAGLSRSAAVASIVHDVTGLPFRGINVPDFRFANGHILRLMHRLMWEV